MYICVTSRLPQARVCIFVAPASSALQRALARKSHALAGLLQTLYLVKETHSSTCADGWRQGDDVTARRQMCGTRWPAPANAFYPWPWGASDVPLLPLNVVSNVIKFRERLWRPGGQVNILAHVKVVKIQCLHLYVCSLATMLLFIPLCFNWWRLVKNSLGGVLAYEVSFNNHQKTTASGGWLK